MVGPLCFRGDIVAHEVSLPNELQSGCAIAVHDAGAYTLAMFSKYNSRVAPPVYGHHGGVDLTPLTDGESIDDALAMWQLPGIQHTPTGIMGARARTAAMLVAAAGAGALLAVAVMRYAPPQM